MAVHPDPSTWQVARLIPTSGISGAEEQERRVVSALLAVLSAVPSYATALLKPLGAPSGDIQSFIEVEFLLGDRKVRPDGVLYVMRGSRKWVALVEVKTSSNDLEKPQIEDYLDVAREYGFDHVITISNQIAPHPGQHPVDVDRRKLRKAGLTHLSWTELISAAVVQRDHKGVSDPEQAWLLGELVRYLEHPKSGALEFYDMGGSWPSVREAILAQTFRPSDKAGLEVAARWDQLLTYAALRMERVLGVPARVVRTRRQIDDPTVRRQEIIAAMAQSGALPGTLRIPGAVGDISISADLRAQRIYASVTIEAPREGRALTRVNWLLRQLREAPETLRVDAAAAFARESKSELLRDVRATPSVLVDESSSDIRSFTLTLTSAMGTNRAAGKNGFIDSVLEAVEELYGQVVQRLRPWTPKAPQMPSDTAPSHTAGAQLMSNDTIEMRPAATSADSDGAALEDCSTASALDTSDDTDAHVAWPAVE